MTPAQCDSYFADLMKDPKFKEAIFSLLDFYDTDAYRLFKSGKTTDDLIHAQGAANGYEVFRRYFESRITTQAIVDKFNK